LHRVFSKYSVPLYEFTNKQKGKGCIAETLFEKIILFDEKRNFKTRALKRNNKYIVKRYDTLSRLLSSETVDRLHITNEWSADVYKGDYQGENNKSPKNKIN